MEDWKESNTIEELYDRVLKLKQWEHGITFTEFQAYVNTVFKDRGDNIKDLLTAEDQRMGSQMRLLEEGKFRKSPRLDSKGRAWFPKDVI